MKPGGRILVTRPAGQEAGLMQALAAAGYRPLHRPALVVEPLPPSPATRRCLVGPELYRVVIVTSANAARVGLAALDKPGPRRLQGLHWLAVGEATAAILRDHGLDPVTPAAGFNSEALLGLDLLQGPLRDPVLILAGEGGRDLLQAELEARGARVDRIPLYRRRCAGFRWPDEPVDAVLVTSQQGWECIASRVPRTCLVVAGSARIAGLVAAVHSRIAISSSPHDADMLEALARA